MARARYSVRVVPGLNLVYDEFSETSPTMSVTNDAEAVVGEVVAMYGDRRIVYRDTEGDWDELKHEAGRFTGLASLDEATKREVARWAA